MTTKREFNYDPPLDPIVEEPYEDLINKTIKLLEVISTISIKNYSQAEFRDIVVEIAYSLFVNTPHDIILEEEAW